MKHRPFPALLMAAVICIFPPMLRAGEKPLWESNDGPLGIVGSRDNVKRKNEVTVRIVKAGSPADGKLKVGDVIVATGDILEAEANGGQLAVTLQGGKEVSLTIEPLGAFSATAPYDCTKTDKIVTRAADALIRGRDGVPVAKGTRLPKLGSHTNPELLGLLATGEKKYQDVAMEVIRGMARGVSYDGKSLQSKTDKAVGTWETAYDVIALAEAYLLTKDAELLPALKTYTLSLVEGQDPAGLYGHKMANPETNRAPGYGQMSNVSLAAGLAMMLAKKCEVDVPGLDHAIDLSLTYVRRLNGKGTFPYGFHDPREDDWNNNGTSGMAAIMMSMAGDKEAAHFFAACSAASYGNLGIGHASTLFSSYWTPAGANVLGPEMTKRFFPRSQFYFTPRRQWDGSVSQCYNEGNFAGVLLLAYCMPRRALIITGRDADQSLWVDARKADEIDQMGMINLGGRKNTKPSFEYFGHAYPKIRAAAVKSVIGEVIGPKFESKMKSNPDSMKKDIERTIALFPKIKELVNSGNPLERQSALRCYMAVCPEDQVESRLKELAPILTNSKETDEIRAIAANQMMTAGKQVQPWFNDILKFLMEDRPKDNFAEIDAQLSVGLGQICRVLEFDCYKNGFVTDHDLFHRAANRLMEHKRQTARGVGVLMVVGVPKRDFHIVANDLDHILKDDDKTYHTYHNPKFAMEPAVKIFAAHNILEGVGYLTDFILNSDGKAAFKLTMLMRSLPTYGIHAKPVIPRIKESKLVQTMYAQAAGNPEGHRFLPTFEKMLADIENATDGPPLVPLAKAIEQSKAAAATPSE